MKANYHTHTQRCRHAQGAEEDYIQAALEAGISVLGFSDHAPFPDIDYGYRMPYDELQTYFSAVDRLAKEHSSDIIIRKGLEIEFLPKYRAYYERLLETDHLHYLLLGQHFFADPQGEAFFVVHAQDTWANVAYARSISEALHTGCFKMLAHPDLFAMNPFAWDKNCDLATDIILNAALDTGVVLEYNANGFRRGIHEYPDGERYMYPHETFWKKVAEAKAPVIIGSDCHEPNQVWDQCMEKAQQELAKLGIAPLSCMTNI